MDRPLLAIKMLTRVATMAPIRSIVRKRPTAERSFLMTNPMIDIIPKVAEVAKNVVAMLSWV